jgi:hypothetical protein
MTEGVEHSRPANQRVVLGVGLSSKADAAEVRTLVDAMLLQHQLGIVDVAVVATRHSFANDPRLRLGPPVIGYDDALLEEMSEPCERSFGIQARVAETAARLAFGLDDAGLDAPHVARSAHVTVALLGPRGNP